MLPQTSTWSPVALNLAPRPTDSAEEPKILMDSVFGPGSYSNEITWRRTTAHSSAKRYAPVHDVIFYYRKSKICTWNEPRTDYDEAYLDRYYKFDDGDGRLYWRADLCAAGTRKGDSGKPWRGIDPTDKGMHWKFTVQRLDELDAEGRIYWPPRGTMPQYKRHRDELKGKAVSDIWDDINRVNPVGGERLGYPTQKPVALLERLVAASSNPGDLVLDPFCGCGTTIHAAEKLGREWIGIDVTHLAISLIEKRLNDAWPGIEYKVHGTPKDLDGANALAAADKYKFQWWAISLVNAVPFGGKKKGADSGIDGLIYFKPEGKKSEKAIVSVKGGANVSVAMIRDLGHVVDREDAKIGVFITLTSPTGPMTKEAVKAGFYETEYGKYPKLQILTIEDLFAGKKPDIPLVDPSVFKKAAKEDAAKQDSLPL